VASYLDKHWQLTSDTLKRERLVELGTEYIQRTEEG